VAAVEWRPFVAALVFVGLAAMMILTSGVAARIQTPLKLGGAKTGESFEQSQLRMREKKRAHFRAIGVLLLIPAVLWILFGVGLSLT
jgi:hypothetical protein